MDVDVKRTSVQTAFWTVGLGGTAALFVESGTKPINAMKVVGGVAVAAGLGTLVGSLLQQNGASNVKSMLGQTATTAVAGGALAGLLSSGNVRERMGSAAFGAIAGAAGGFAISVDDAAFRGVANWLFDAGW